MVKWRKRQIEILEKSNRVVNYSCSMLVCWYIGIVISPLNLELILCFVAMVSSILCICFTIIAIMKQIKPNVSGYKIFAWIDSIIGVGVGIYAVYDILTDKGWFAGLLGWLLVIFVIPVIVALLIIDFILYKIQNRKYK